jgi:hypothetical protein
MKYLRYLALLSALTALCSLSAFARDKSQHSVNISEAVQVGGTQLQPGTYKVEWTGTAPDVQVSFLQHGKTVATAPGKLRTDTAVSQDQVVTDGGDTANKALHEIDFHRDNQALIFQQSGM